MARDAICASDDGCQSCDILWEDWEAMVDSVRVYLLNGHVESF